ncbi:4-hydroxy-tetrahydrodipicolinate synthase [Tissierella creatinophila]|uniref:4-hydroxy-tetrahydrodipicolinate synthase n=1 Tax=Tissierella creatinophila DSM 6911 TaxID=1123403 RepID=A0A1U7M528_TISCR|nr:4-hydroxy-tetrahydrodipicolinate synthase [Tissierella creatinophila]OLS02360.1 4-hydroxy-tetrahydrodipicolinate synthase [Tissierella creatinophila DSM 6911]
MKDMIFKGAATAIVTPFNRDGIDFESFSKLIEWQIGEGINAIVVCGTTGESSTMSDEEHKEAVKFVVDQVNGRVPVIAGTGSNDIAYGIELTKYACEVGADAMLVVTPYYNKATQKGLIELFTKIADASTKPIILYNVPSRTGVNLQPKTCQVLADHPNIVGLKEASGDISQIAKIAQLCGDKISIYSGNDDQIVPIMSLGGKGVISVVSNIMPRETVEICDKFFSGDVSGSLDLQLKLLPLINSLFTEVNPIPVKAAVSAMGYCEDILRLPLTSMEDENKENMISLMKEQGIQLR